MTQQSLEPKTTAEDAGDGTRVPAGKVLARPVLPHIPAGIHRRA
ncbi:hypothetical protein SGRIM128S_08551 [Streptomyces griseomycini]